MGLDILIMEANQRNGASYIMAIFNMSVCVLLPGGITLEFDFFKIEISGYLAISNKFNAR